MIYGETEHTDGIAIINVRWPQCHLYKIFGESGGEDVECYVWADSFGDALESAAEWGGEEGDDDDLLGNEITGRLYVEIKATTDAFNAKLDDIS